MDPENELAVRLARKEQERRELHEEQQRRLEGAQAKAA
jgi:hypothetical protein